jgi:hypothetical protein
MKLKSKLITGLTTGVLGCVLLTSNGLAATHTYTYTDDWVNWPGYTSKYGDEVGTPKIESIQVVVEDFFLKTVNVILHDSTKRQFFDSLFINSSYLVGTAWDKWDYFIHDGGSLNSGLTSGNVPGDGLYSVSDPYDYTITTAYRKNNPNGIDADSLTLIDSSVGGTQSGYIVSYSLEGLNIDASNGFFVAYAPFCANDVIGGGKAPEPAAMLLFGIGLVGLTGIVRKKEKEENKKFQKNIL